MAIDIIARGLALSLLNDDGKLASDMMPGLEETGTTQYAVGGIPTGMSLEGKTWEEIIILMLFGVILPVFTSPKLLVSKLPTVGVANRELEISGNIIFDRGKIQPANGTSGFRAGLPSYYIIGDETKVTQETNINFKYLIPSLSKGTNTFSIIVYYDEGEQPLDSSGKEFDKPFPAGSITYTLTIEGQSPVYAGLEDGVEVDLNNAYFDNTKQSQGAGYNISSVAEVEETDKWSIAFPSDLAIVGIKQYDIISQQWQWLGGSPEASFTYFNISPIEKEINGIIENYTSYSNALDLVGERELRFYTVLPKGE